LVQTPVMQPGAFEEVESNEFEIDPVKRGSGAVL
jgi:hypothetical protein